MSPPFFTLYPAATVGLAVLVLRERATRLQAMGILQAVAMSPA
jgi:drug/metabolite transporter (DMT)-like permease